MSQEGLKRCTPCCIDLKRLRGATGPTGPTGPVGLLEVYGGLYNNNPQVLELIVGTPKIVGFNNMMPLNSVTANTTSLTITDAGIYEINWNLIGSTENISELVMAIRRNGTNIPATVVNRSISQTVEPLYSGSILVSLAAGDVIDMAISALADATLTLNGGANATISLKKISA